MDDLRPREFVEVQETRILTNEIDEKSGRCWEWHLQTDLPNPDRKIF